MLSTTTLKFRGVDVAGNVSDIAQEVYTIDNAGPGVTLDLAAASDSGVSNSDNLTNDATPTFTGTTEAGATVRILNGINGPQIGGPFTAANGNYSITTTALASGTYPIVAEARDAAGNVSSVALNPALRIDRVAPRVTGRTPAPGATGVGIAVSPTATFSEPVRFVNGGTFTLKRGTTGVRAVVSYDAANRRATLNPSANLANRVTYTATLTSGIKDPAGNSLAQTAWRFTTR